MPDLIIALAIAFGGYWLLRQFVATPATQVAGVARKAGGFAPIAIAGFLTLRGAFSVAIPLFIMGLGFLGKSGLFPGGFPWAQRSAGQRSRVATSLLAMELEHDSGRMEGSVLGGPFKGRRLSALGDEEPRQFHPQSMGVNEQSLGLLQASRVT